MATSPCAVWATSRFQGRRSGRLRETIKTAYSKILNNPPVSVVMKDFEKPYFVADGQVAKPGKYEMHGMTTVTQAIAMAGGFQSTAKHSQVVLFRRVDDQWTEAKLINVKKMENKRDPARGPRPAPRRHVVGAEEHALEN